MSHELNSTPSFPQLLCGLSERMQALREFVEFVDPAIEDGETNLLQKEAPHLMDIVVGILDAIAKEKRAQSNQVVQSQNDGAPLAEHGTSLPGTDVMLPRSNRLPNQFEGAVAPPKVVDGAPHCGDSVGCEGGRPVDGLDTENSVFDGDIGHVSPSVPPESVEKVADDFKVELTKVNGKAAAVVRFNAVLAPQFMREIGELTKWIEHRRQLYESSLLTLLSVIEHFVSRLLHRYYDNNPGALSSSNRSFTLAELSEFDNIADARAYLVEQKIENVLRGSLSEWLRFFNEKMKLGMGYLDMEDRRDRLVEAAQRRNLIVHNGGVVNRVYLRNTAKKLQSEAAGVRLDTSREYLDERIDLFEICFLLVGFEAWKNDNADDGERAAILNSIAYKRLREGRFAVADSLSDFAKRDKKSDEVSQLVGTVNHWLCAKRRSKKKWDDSVRADVEQTDFNAKGLRFRLARLALLDDADGFFKLVPQALASKEIDLQALREFPVFEEVRHDPRFAAYL